MNLIDFISFYPDEESCKQKFKEYRDQVGVSCAKCGGTSHYWKQDKEQYECKACATRTTLKSGTVMHKSKLPYRYWFMTMHLLTSTKKGFSAKEIQRQRGYFADCIPPGYGFGLPSTKAISVIVYNVVVFNLNIIRLILSRLY